MHALSTFCLILVLAIGALAQPAKRTVTLGVLQGGEYAPHNALRGEFRTQLELLLPDSIQAVFAASVFKSAEWNRSTCKRYAQELAQSRDIDIVLAIGPWAIEDLLEAGFGKPIIGMYQPLPQFQGLLDSTNRPIASNLTVTYSPDDLADDLLLLTGITKVKKLGLLYFPSGDESQRVLDEINLIGKELGFEAVFTEGYDNVGTYAYFKAYAQLDTTVDAVYVMPLWGIESDQVSSFAERMIENKRASVTWEGRYPVERGILVSGTGTSLTATARFNAWKALRIIQGATPADLLTVLPDDQLITINERTADKLQLQLPFELLGQAEMVGLQSGDAPSYLGLSEAIDRALAQNPGYLAGQEAITQATARASEAWSAYLPQISAEAAAEYLSDEAAHNLSATVNEPNLIKNERYLGALTVDQQVFSLQTIRAIKASTLESDRQKLGAAQAGVDLELAVTLAYLNMLRTNELVTLSRRQRLLIDHSLEIARARTITGEGIAADVSRWHAERLMSSSRLLASQADAYAAKVLLNALLNQPANTEWSLDSIPASSETFWTAYQRYRPHLVSQQALQRTQEKLLALALQQNQTMQAARSDIELQKQRLGLNSSTWVPTLGLRGSLFFSDWYSDVHGVFEEENPGWSLGASLRWSLFDGGRRGKVRRGLTARLNELEYLRDDVSLDIMQQVQVLTSRLATLSGQAIAGETLQERAVAHINAALSWYSSGKENYTAVLDAAELSEAAQKQFIESKFAYLSTVAQLVHQLGISPNSENTMFLQALFSRLSPPSNGG